MPTYIALERAEQVGLDLVEVGANADPPVCKIMDFGKYKYDLARKQRDKQRGAKQTVVKTIKVRPKIGAGDLETKINQASKFLLDGSKVKVQIQFKGREISHKNLGRDLLDKIATSVSGSAIIETAPNMDGRLMVMMLAPNK